MSDSGDINVVATSALLGATATLIQELVVADAINPTRLLRRLDDFVNQESIRNAPQAERDVIHRIIEALKMGIDLGTGEHVDNAG